MKLDHKFIKINSEKEPQHSLDKSFKYKDIENEPNVAVLITEPYVVLDIDDNESFDLLYKIILDEKIKCRVMRTDRGGHFWFKCLTSLTNWIGTNTPLTIKVDVKSWGLNKDGSLKKSMITIKKDGQWREWLKQDENVDELPFWLSPNKLKKDLIHLKQGDGRDPQLFSYIIPLINLKFNKDQIYKIFNLINKYVFDEPLKQEEIDKMFDDNDIFDNKDLQFFEKRTFMHNIFADWLKESYFFKSYGRQMYLYDKGLYIDSKDEIQRKMIEQIPKLTVRQQNEAYENLRLKITSHNEKIDPMVVNVQNGLLDLKKACLIDHSPYVFTINQINATFDETAYDKNVDKMIQGVTENNPNLIQLIKEMLGYLLIGDCRFQKAFILLGNGSNGKSKFLEMIMNWIGFSNCSSLALEDLNKEFVVAELADKIANIGDDSGADLLKNTAIFKKIVTGDSITVQKKYGQPFILNNKAKLLFSANTLPPSTDKSDGFFRRIVIVPFNAVFKPGMKDFDPNISDKVNSDNARSYLLNLALEGCQTILKNNCITIPSEVQSACETYETDNNNVLQWLESDNIELIDRTIQQVYTDYCLYCNNVNSRPVQIRKFNMEVKKKFPLLKISHVVTKTENNYIWKK